MRKPTKSTKSKRNYGGIKKVVKSVANKVKSYFKPKKRNIKRKK